MKLVKNTLRSKNVHFFPNFVVKLKAFELTNDYLILYFPVVYSQYRAYVENFSLLA